MLCEYGHGRCTAPDTICPHWQGTFCVLDQILAQLASNDTPKANPNFITPDERRIKFYEFVQNEETVIKTIKEEDVFN